MADMNPDVDWINRTARDLLKIEAELRPLLRGLRYHRQTETAGQPPATTRAGQHGDRVVLAAHEARTLLRGAIPYPVTTNTSLRQPHARLLVGLRTFGIRLLALNDPLSDPEAPIAAGLALVELLHEWLAVLRWQQACRAARVRWPYPVAIRPILRPEAPERCENKLPPVNRLEPQPLEANPTDVRPAAQKRKRA